VHLLEMQTHLSTYFTVALLSMLASQYVRLGSGPVTLQMAEDFHINYNVRNASPHAWAPLRCRLSRTANSSSCTQGRSFRTYGHVQTRSDPPAGKHAHHFTHMQGTLTFWLLTHFREVAVLWMYEVTSNEEWRRCRSTSPDHGELCHVVKGRSIAAEC